MDAAFGQKIPLCGRYEASQTSLRDKISVYTQKNPKYDIKITVNVKEREDSPKTPSSLNPNAGEDQSGTNQDLKNSQDLVFGLI